MFVPYRSVPLLIITIGIGFIIWSYFEPSEYNRSILFTSGILSLFSGLVLPFLYKLNKTSWAQKSLQKENSDYYARRDKRNIILTEREFIFQTSDSEMAWSWETVRSCQEAENAFILDFYSGHRRSIAKRIFTDPQQIDSFKLLIQQYRDLAKSNE